MKARLLGGILSKALRGELQVPLPTGLIYDAQQRVQLDPDKQVQGSFTFLFTTFNRTRSATATMKAFRKNELLFPRRVRKGPQKGELIWEALNHLADGSRNGLQDYSMYVGPNFDIAVLEPNSCVLLGSAPPD